jgi:NTP pyrophosphatase (non-canonical NTP hydrolase)
MLLDVDMGAPGAILFARRWPYLWSPHPSSAQDRGMTLDEICQNVRTLSDRHGWDQDDPAHRMLAVTAEVGEVADAVLAVQRAADGGVSGRLDAAKRAVGYEIYDAIWNLCALANALDVDLTTAAHEKAETNAARTWT